MMYFVCAHPFNRQPSRMRQEMAEFCEREVLRLLLTVEYDRNDVQTLVELLREKAALLGLKYRVQAPLRVENCFNRWNGGYVSIYSGSGNYDRYCVGTLRFYRVHGVADKKFFEDLRKRISTEEEGGAA